TDPSSPLCASTQSDQIRPKKYIFRPGLPRSAAKPDPICVYLRPPAAPKSDEGGSAVKKSPSQISSNPAHASQKNKNSHLQPFATTLPAAGFLPSFRSFALFAFSAVNNHPTSELR